MDSGVITVEGGLASHHLSQPQGWIKVPAKAVQTSGPHITPNRVFEGVVRLALVKHIEQDNLLTDGPHGSCIQG